MAEADRSTAQPTTSPTPRTARSRTSSTSTSTSAAAPSPSLCNRRASTSCNRCVASVFC
jgi:hypothetical protein